MEDLIEMVHIKFTDEQLSHVFIYIDFTRFIYFWSNYNIDPGKMNPDRKIYTGMQY